MSGTATIDLRVSDVTMKDVVRLFNEGRRGGDNPHPFGSAEAAIWFYGYCHQRQVDAGAPDPTSNPAGNLLGTVDVSGEYLEI